MRACRSCWTIAITLLLSRLAFAETGMPPEALMQQAARYEDGAGVERDVHKAMELYKQAAQLLMRSPEGSAGQSPLASEALELTETNATANDLGQQVVQEVISDLPDRESRRTALQIITSEFGLETHRANYVLPYSYDFREYDDREGEESLLQFSLRYPLKENWLGWDEEWYLGYTQKSWWQTFAASKPFRETNYQPEVFVRMPLDWGNFRGAEMGFLHESNGQGGTLSRSWNRFYASVYYQWGRLYLKPRIWYRLPERDKEHPLDDKGDDNPDIQSYYGYGDLMVGLISASHHLQATWRNNLRGDHNRGALELHWSFPLPFSERDDVYGFVYGFTGYGESLIDYDRSIDKVGLGVAFSR